VKYVVGKTVQDFIDSKNSIVLAFVGHERFPDLEVFEKNFERAASKFKKHHKTSDVIFAKINQFKNDFPDIFSPNQLKPSVFFVPANDKQKPVLLQKSDFVSVDSIMNFVEENLIQLEDKKTEL
jgi:hypothetical protein